MTDPDAIAGLSLEFFVALSARMIGLATADECRAVQRDAGITDQAWDAANAGWAERLRAAGPGSELVTTHRRLLIEALRRVDDRPPLSLDQYVEINGRIQSGEAPTAAFAAFDHTMASFSASSYEWMDRFAADPWLEVYFKLRVHKLRAERTGRAHRDIGAVYGPGNLVRGRRCHRCGGLKATRPSSAYVYCDYCATLFDYDPASAVADPSALDPDMVDRELHAVSGEALGRAAAAGDRAEYARITRWRCEVATEVCPAAYSPRVRDPSYRRQLIDDLLVPWTVATRFDSAVHTQGRAVSEASSIAQHRPSIDNILELLGRSRALWQLEAELLEREGIFAAHPDDLDGSLYHYINASTFVRPWLAALFPPDQERLLDAAGVRCEYIPMPRVDMWSRTCGHCGQKLSIPEGALRFVCEGCGHVLDAVDRVFPCASCDAAVCLPRGATEATCAYCTASWTL